MGNVIANLVAGGTMDKDMVASLNLQHAGASIDAVGETTASTAGLRWTFSDRNVDGVLTKGVCYTLSSQQIGRLRKLDRARRRAPDLIGVWPGTASCLAVAVGALVAMF